MKKKILIVEDNPEFCQFLEYLLHSMGYEPIGIGSGEEAIARARSDQPALILMDIRLPGMDGVEAAAAIKQNPDTSGIPIVVLSAYISEEWQQKAFDAGIRTYLTKPAPPQTIRETINLIMARESANRQRFSSL
jgi:CheY-like chemotaxis protein